MTFRTVAAFTLFMSLLWPAPANAQVGAHQLDTKARVLNLVFPLDVEPRPYFTKLVLRFGDSDTQLVVLTYPSGKSEMICYSLSGMDNNRLSQLISRMIAEDPHVEDKEIAAKLKVDIKRSPIDPTALGHFLNQLKAIRVSPALATRTAVDEYYEYDYWYDTWQESVHYTISGPFKNTPQDQLVQWMLRFRGSLPQLMKPTGPRTITK